MKYLLNACMHMIASTHLCAFKFKSFLFAFFLAA